MLLLERTNFMNLKIGHVNYKNRYLWQQKNCTRNFTVVSLCTEEGLAAQLWNYVCSIS